MSSRLEKERNDPKDGNKSLTLLYLALTLLIGGNTCTFIIRSWVQGQHYSQVGGILYLLATAGIITGLLLPVFYILIGKIKENNS